MKDKMKIITICGSIKFKDEMAKTAIQLELAGNNVLMPILPTKEISLTDEEISKLGNIHKEKIKISDAIFVINVSGYIGKSTESEIEFAKSLNKEIIYYTDKREK